MNKFLLLSITAMFLVFYELSGGSDFEPLGSFEAVAQNMDGSRAAAPRNRATDTQPLMAANAAEAAPVATAAVATVPASPTPTPAKRVAPAAKPADPAMVTRASAGTNDLPSTSSDVLTPEMLAKIEQMSLSNLPRAKSFAATTTTSAPEPAQSADIREVTGNRVNMRTGPGTNYAVVSTLSKGAEVEVIGSEGDWVNLKLPAGATGWMADWLVSASAD